MLKHVLETKHEDDNFKCAVIVNDMAELNIDKSLIDQSALVQSEFAQSENAYLIFVIFFTLAKFLENKIYTEKRQFFALNL